MQSYHNLLRNILNTGTRKPSRPGVDTISLFGAQWQHNMAGGFPLLTTKRVPLRHVFHELMWFLSGSTNAAELRKHGVTIWDEWSSAEQCAKFGRQADDLGHIYGGLWRNFSKMHFNSFYGRAIEEYTDEERFAYFNSIRPGNDQIRTLLDDLRDDPHSRRLIVSGWNPLEQKNVALPPCHTMFQVYCVGHRISLHLYMRSCDAFLGLPFNIAGYALLLELLGVISGRVPEHLTISFGDLHIYENHFDQVLTQLDRQPKQLPRVWYDIQRDPENDWLKTLLGVKWSDITLDSYNPDPSIPAPVAV